MESMIGQEEIELIKKEGKTIRGLIPKSTLSINRLKELQEDNDPAIAETVTNLLNVVNMSINNLITDEYGWRVVA